MSQREYGGYMEMEHLYGKEYHMTPFRFNTAHHALRFLLREREIRTIYLPRYICPVVFEACREENVEAFWYDVDMNFRPVSETVPKDAWFYFINYYGQFDEVEIRALQKRHPYMIVDNIQAFFQKPVLGLDTIYTCRKFFGVSDGAYLYTNLSRTHYEQLPFDESCERIDHLVGRFERDASSFYSSMQKVEKSLIHQPIRRMSHLTQNFLRGFDYGHIIKARTKNFARLHQFLSEDNLLSVHSVDGGYMYPFMVKGASKIRKELIAQKIYVPLLWPNEDVERDVGSIAWKLTHDILPLPIDQRYNVEDMDVIAEAVRMSVRGGM